MLLTVSRNSHGWNGRPCHSEHLPRNATCLDSFLQCDAEWEKMQAWMHNCNNSVSVLSYSKEGSGSQKFRDYFLSVGSSVHVPRAAEKYGWETYWHFSIPSSTITWAPIYWACGQYLYMGSLQVCRKKIMKGSLEEGGLCRCSSQISVNDGPHLAKVC